MSFKKQFMTTLSSIFGVRDIVQHDDATFERRFEQLKVALSERIELLEMALDEKTEQMNALQEVMTVLLLANPNVKFISTPDEEVIDRLEFDGFMTTGSNVDEGPDGKLLN